MDRIIFEGVLHEIALKNVCFYSIIHSLSNKYERESLVHINILYAQAKWHCKVHTLLPTII